MPLVQPCLQRLHSYVLLVAFVLAAVISAFPQQSYLPIVNRPPHDVPGGRDASLEQLAKFAWQEFLALNWKASMTSYRGTPDATWNYSTKGPYPQLLVWQTYTQTTELRPNSPLTTTWNGLGTPATRKPTYSYQVKIAPGSSNAKFNLWNNLDEDSEIGSCNIYRNYNPQKSDDLVLFQVKVNKAEYEYLRVNFGKDQNNPNGLLGTTQAAVMSYIQNTTSAPYSYYAGAQTTCNCPPGKAICLPCGDSTQPADNAEGAIEVKTAWRHLLPTDDPSHFYTTTAQYYDTDAKGNLVYRNGTFALIGMHIIHKTKSFPDFVFATFEQIEVENSGYQYILLNNGTQTGNAVAIKRQGYPDNNATEMHPVPQELDTVSNAVHQQLAALNPNIPWQFYRLSGVQGKSVSCPVEIGSQKPTEAQCVARSAGSSTVVIQPSTCTKIDPNYFMANFVVESDPFLNNFSGPGFGPNPFPKCQNTIHNGQIYDNGGCKGCHGVAQTGFGTDFSFLLDFGNNKPSISPATIHYVPPSSELTTESHKKRGRKHYLDLLQSKHSK